MDKTETGRRWRGASANEERKGNDIVPCPRREGNATQEGSSVEGLRGPVRSQDPAASYTQWGRDLFVATRRCLRFPFQGEADGIHFRDLKPAVEDESISDDRLQSRDVLIWTP